MLVFLTAVGLTASTEMSLTVEKLKEFIRSAITLKQPDRQVAEYLHHVKMVEKLDDHTVEELQGMGAGPKTVAALHDLRDASASLPQAVPPPPKPVVIPLAGPDSIEQGRIIDEVRQYALNYTKNLPNFICVQVTRRDVDQRGNGSWYHVDTITSRLSYNGQKEDYQVVLVNNMPVTNMSMEQLGGTVSAGEFGSMMKEIFELGTHARFEWDRWATLRGRRTYVFAYDVEQQYSKYHILADKTLNIVPAYRGFVYIDRDTKMVTKITLNPYDFPAGFPITESHQALDYDFQKIGDAEFLLPLKSVLTVGRSNYATKNDIEFRLYRKFGTESTIKFDTPEPLPEEKTTEKPPEEKPKKPN